ncbi:hypothetical protein JXA47_17140 [Candidatus Sumerlaeota bacterium]|nr:hypothetical protein [Candidatus Sumerlaeota bacterium]
MRSLRSLLVLAAALTLGTMTEAWAQSRSRPFQSRTNSSHSYQSYRGAPDAYGYISSSGGTRSYRWREGRAGLAQGARYRYESRYRYAPTHYHSSHRSRYQTPVYVYGSPYLQGYASYGVICPAYGYGYGYPYVPTQVIVSYPRR